MPHRVTEGLVVILRRVSPGRQIRRISDIPAMSRWKILSNQHHHRHRNHTKPAWLRRKNSSTNKCHEWTASIIPTSGRLLPGQISELSSFVPGLGSVYASLAISHAFCETLAGGYGIYYLGFGLFFCSWNRIGRHSLRNPQLLSRCCCRGTRAGVFLETYLFLLTIGLCRA